MNEKDYKKINIIDESRLKVVKTAKSVVKVMRWIAIVLNGRPCVCLR